MPDPTREPCARVRERPPDELLLAAIERAVLHDRKARGAVTVSAICEHLGAPRRSPAARHIRSRLALLHGAGWLERSRRHGVATWATSDAGRRYLARVERAGRRIAELPESPQHRLWRDARRNASEELERFDDALLGLLERASTLLAVAPPPHSDQWFALGEQLARACRRVGSASHCLYEWPEPSDAHADVDDYEQPSDRCLDPGERAAVRARRRGRRNVRLW
jgi:hypothetical protein